MYCRIWVPRGRAEPFFPLSPRRPCWTISPGGAAAGLPPAWVAASAPNGIILNRSPPCGLPSPANFSSSCLTVPSVEPNRPADPRRQCQLRSHKMQGGNDWAPCAKRPPVTLPGRTSPARCNASLPGIPVLPARFRFPHHTGNTAPETLPLYFGPIDADKTTEATLYKQPRSDVCSLSPSRSADKCPQPSECSLGRHPFPPSRLADRSLVLANSTNSNIYNTVILVFGRKKKAGPPTFHPTR